MMGYKSQLATPTAIGRRRQTETEYPTNRHRMLYSSSFCINDATGCYRVQSKQNVDCEEVCRLHWEFFAIRFVGTTLMCRNSSFPSPPNNQQPAGIPRPSDKLSQLISPTVGSPKREPLQSSSSLVSALRFLVVLCWLVVAASMVIHFSSKV